MLKESLFQGYIYLESSFGQGQFKPGNMSTASTNNITQEDQNCDFGLNSALSLIQAWFKPYSSLFQAWLDLGS